MTAPACELSNVSAGYDGNPVLKNLSLTVAEGEIAALLGPNGAGKSTLLRVLTGLLPPAAGAVRLFGADLHRLSAAARARLVAVVPQEFHTPMAYRVEELVMLGRAVRLPFWRQPTAADHQVVARVMAYTDVAELRDRPLAALSGGEKQRVVIALALAQEPRLILMDEPTTHLDLNHALEIMQIVERLNREQGVTVLMTSHDFNLAAAFCRRLVLLDGGQIAADGAPGAVLRQDILREVYHCDLHVREDPGTGVPFVIFAGHARPVGPARRLRVHVIAGGGSGAALLRQLALAGYRVSCGVLNQLDSDTQCAAALEMELALEKPFSPLGPEALARARRLAAESAALVVCELPFGPGNLANIELAETALARGAPVLVNDHNLPGRDYTPGQAAAARLQALLRAGAQPWRQPGEALAALARLAPPETVP